MWKGGTNMKTNKHYERVKEIVDVISHDPDYALNMRTFKMSEVYELAAKIMLAEKLESIANAIDLIKCGD